MTGTSSAAQTGMPAMLVDCGDIAQLRRYLASDLPLAGATTNPSLLHQAGVRDYYGFAEEAVALLNGKSLSLEVVEEEPGEVVRQAERLSRLGRNVHVKIPLVTSRGADNSATVRKVSELGINVNVTAVTTVAQARRACAALLPGSGILSVFAGRIADTGIEPVPLVKEMTSIAHACSIRSLWASPREVLNVVQAAHCRCDFITLPPALLDKLGLLGGDLESMSVDAVRTFVRDARLSGLRL